MEAEFRIGEWLVRPEEQQLVGPQGMVPLSREAVRLLVHLAARPGEVVSREEVCEALFGSREAPPGKLTQCVRLLRLALDDPSRNPSLIETVPRRGFRLLAEVRGPDATEPAARYHRHERIGDGGMGVVYKAEDTKLRRTVALKFLPSAWSRDPEAKRRFLAEAQAAASLDHPNICTLHEVDQTPDGQLFFVMAYYEGETLKARLLRGALPWREAVRIARKVALGLAHAHERGVIHRDVKPANIMLTTQGEVKVLDFGVAKLAGNAGMTRTGTAIGTPTHMSPEQVRGFEVDGRTDVWSLGVVLYEMVSGDLPFHGTGEHAVLYSIVHQEAAPLTQLAGEVPLELQQIVDKALAKEPGDRYGSIDELLADLDRLEQGTAISTRQLRSVVGDLQVSIAVLPFADLSPERDQEYFCDGLAEELIAALTSVRELRVASRTSAFQFKGRGEDLVAIGQRLRVTNLLAGSVRKAGNRVRITVELVTAADGFGLWSERFDRELEDIFEIQDEIARTVVGTLRGRLVGAETGARLVRPHTDDLEAYNLYLKGRHHWNKRTEEGLSKSVSCLRQAIERDPGYARAYAALADAYATLGIYGAAEPAQVMPAARAAASQALALDDSLAEAHVCLGCVQALYEHAWDEAERSFGRGLELDPRYATGHQWYAMNFLVPRGRFDEAAAALRKARELDPLSLAVNVSQGVALFFARRYEDAVDAYRRTLELDASFAMAHFFLGQAWTELGKHEEAVAALERARELAGGSAEVLASLGYALACGGHRQRAEVAFAELAAIAAERFVSPVLKAQIELALGRREAALGDLEDAFERRAADLAWLRVRPAFEALRAEPRFARLIDRLGLGGPNLPTVTQIDRPTR